MALLRRDVDDADEADSAHLLLRHHHHHMSHHQHQKQHFEQSSNVVSSTIEDDDNGSSGKGSPKAGHATVKVRKKEWGKKGRTGAGLTNGGARAL